MARGRGALPTIAEAAKAEAARLRLEADARIQARGLPPLADYVHELSPQFSAPYHLKPMIRHVEAWKDRPFQIVFSVPPRHGKPLEGSTPVRMADGSLRPLREVRLGDRVVSGTGRPTMVTGVYPQGLLPVWEVVTTSGLRFRAEGSHCFLTGARGWKRVDELRAARRPDSLVQCEQPELDEPGAVVGVEYLPRPWGSRLCAGRWVADAVVSVRPAGRAECFCITVAQDESFLVTAGNLVTHNTETLLHLVPWILRQNPRKRIGYVSYSMSIARKQALKVQRLCHAAGVRMATHKVMDWETPEGGHFVATGIGGMLTGMGFDILIVDDPTKDRATAESRVYRDRIYDWFTSTAYTRLMPGGSVIVCGTRWHVDDLQGRLAKGDAEMGRPPWECVNLPAIADDPEEAEKLGRGIGTALWPEMWPTELLDQRRAVVGSYDWSSLYQGRPVPRGGNVFGEIVWYDELPTSYRVGIGLDLAATEKSKGDTAVALVGWYVPQEDAIYVVNGPHKKATPLPEFKKHLYETIPEYCKPNVAAWRFYGYGMELGAAQFMRYPPDPIPVVIVQGKGDKLVRATPYAAAWNAGKVKLPSKEFRDRQEEAGAVPERWGWVNPLVSHHVNFTGKKEGEADDFVDAGAAMHDVLRPPGRGPPPEPVRQFTFQPWQR